MKSSLFILSLCINLFCFGQSDSQQKLEKANKLYQAEKYEQSLTLFRELYRVTNKSDSSYQNLVFGYGWSLFLSVGNLIKTENNWDSVIKLSNEFLEVLKTDSALMDEALQNKKYWIYKNFVVAYFGLNQLQNAKIYQDYLYKAYKSKQLPKGLYSCYNFEKFVYKNQNVWGYEWFANLGDPDAEGSFSKQVYYIYSRDKLGNDKSQLFTLETVKIHKLKNDLPDFVLTKRIYSKDNEQSETIWAYTFNNPIDYTLLHNSVIEYLDGGVKSDTKTLLKR